MRAEGRACSTSTSRSSGPGPSSGRRATGGWGERTGSRSTRRCYADGADCGDRRRCSATPSSCTTRRSGSRSRSEIVRGMGGDRRDAARACAIDMVRAVGARTRTSDALRGRAPGARRAARRHGLEDRARSRTASAISRSSRRTIGSTSTRVVGSRAHGRVEAARVDLRRGARALDVRTPDETAMVGDSVRGRHRGRACARHAARSCSTATACNLDEPDRIDTLLALAAGRARASSATA